MSKGQGDDTAAYFTIAVNRRGSDKADFFSCKAKGRTAENLCKYKGKGDKLAVTGPMFSYRKDGEEFDRWMIAAYDIEFLDSRSSGSGGSGARQREPGEELDDEPTGRAASSTRAGGTGGGGGYSGRRGRRGGSSGAEAQLTEDDPF